MKSVEKTLEDFRKSSLPDSTLRLVRRCSPPRGLLFLVLIALCGVISRQLHRASCATMPTERYNRLFGDGVLLDVTCLLLGVLGCLGLWLHARYFREEFLLRQNYLERRTVFGRWRKATRITDGWVYLEECDSSTSTRSLSYRVRVRGKGGEVILSEHVKWGPDDRRVPVSVATLAEFISQETGWRLDVPQLLQNNAQIRTL